jgi:riboflavin kinase / FMN adenylyltransferase
MQQYHSLENLNVASSCVTIGVFDGVHIGHRKVIQTMLAESKAQQNASVVITFYPHPAIVLGKIDTPQYLLDDETKAKLIESMGVNYLLTLPFTKEFATIEAEDFVQRLIDTLKMSCLITGEDFTLGKNKQGNATVLDELSQKYNFQFHLIQEVDANGNRISSTLIRNLIRNGEIKNANHLLGRYYHFSGGVVNGDHRGRKFGFPTANLKLNSERLYPKFGVYATFVQVENHILPAITNIGIRPTFKDNESKLTIETYILDFNDSIYEKSMDLYFVEFIRPERKFSSAELLYKQIEHDILKAREILAHAKKEKSLFIGSAGIRP